MDRHKVIEAFCELSATVGRSALHCNEPFDCFCHFNSDASESRYEFSKTVLNYIREAVYQRMRSESVPGPWSKPHATHKDISAQ